MRDLNRHLEEVCRPALSDSKPSFLSHPPRVTCRRAHCEYHTQKHESAHADPQWDTRQPSWGSGREPLQDPRTPTLSAPHGDRALSAREIVCAGICALTSSVDCRTRQTVFPGNLNTSPGQNSTAVTPQMQTMLLSKEKKKLLIFDDDKCAWPLLNFLKLPLRGQGGEPAWPHRPKAAHQPSAVLAVRRAPQNTASPTSEAAARARPASGSRLLAVNAAQTCVRAGSSREAAVGVPLTAPSI